MKLFYTLRTSNNLILKDNTPLENKWLWQVSSKHYYEPPPGPKEVSIGRPKTPPK